MNRKFLFLWCVGVVVGLVLNAVPMRLPAQQGLFDALYVYKFCSFVKFPAERQSGDFVIGVLAAPDFIPQLEKTVAGKTIGSQPIKVKAVDAASAAASCHIVYVGDTKQLAKVLDAVRGKPTLVVSKGSGLAQAGAHINIFTNGDKKFEVNRAAGESAGLKFSADLLKLATLL
jgi:hypothetical protein